MKLSRKLFLFCYHVFMCAMVKPYNKVSDHLGIHDYFWRRLPGLLYDPDAFRFIPRLFMRRIGL